MILFMAIAISYCYFIYCRSQKQQELINTLNSSGIMLEKTYPEWSVKLPDIIKNFIGYNLNLDIYIDDLKVYLDDKEISNSELIKKISNLEGVNSLYYSSRGTSDFDSDNVNISLNFLDAISRCSTIKELDLHVDNLTSAHAKAIGNIRTLKSLRIFSSATSKDIIFQLSRLEDLSFLKIETSSRFYKNDLENLKKLEGLEILLLGVDHTNLDSSYSGYYNFYNVENILPPLKNLKYLGTTLDVNEVDFTKFPSLFWFNNSDIKTDSKTLKKLADKFGGKGQGIIKYLNKNDFNLNRLTVDYSVTDVDLDSLNLLNFLNSLTFQNPDLDFGRINWSNFKNLNELELPVGISIKELMPYLKQLKKLKYIKGSGSDFTFESYKELKTAGIFLEGIYLIDNRTDEAEYEKEGINFQSNLLGDEFFSINDLKNFPDKNLSVVNLVVDKISPGIIDALNEYKHLDSLYIKCNRGVENLNNLDSRSSIKHLEIAFYKLPSSPLKGFKRLERLNVRYRFETGNLSQFVETGGLPLLKSLNLESDTERSISLDGIELLSQLTVLSLSNGDFTCRKVISLKELEVLIISGTCDIDKFILGKKLEIFDIKEMEITNSSQFKQLLPYANYIDTLNLKNILDFELFDLQDLHKFRNLDYLSLPPKPISINEYKDLISKLKKLNYVKIANTGLTVEDTVELQLLNVSYD